MTPRSLSALRLVALAATLVGAGCATGSGGEGGGGGGRDAGAPFDSGNVPVDAGVPSDAGDLDAAMIDAGALDGGLLDAGMLDAGPPDAGMPDAGTACTTALAAARQTFEAGAGGWTHRGMDGVSTSWPIDPWENGTPSAVGPSACGEGSQCWGTDLDRNYAQCGRAELRSPSIDLGACSGATIVMVWEQWYDFWTGSYGGSTWYDGGLVEISTNGGSSWAPVDPSIYPGTVRINPDRGLSYACLQSDSFYVHGRPGFVGSSGGWETAEVALSVSGPFLVRFAWGSGVSSSTTNADTSRSATRPGWYVDDVRFEAR